MKAIVDAFWRAGLEVLHPRVILWSLLPLSVALLLVLGSGWLYWEAAVGGVRAVLEQWDLMALVLQWLEAVGGAGLRAVVAPLIVVALALPLIVLATLLQVAWLLAPALVAWVAARRHAALERRGAGAWRGVAYSLGCAVVALLALVVSLPLWLVPPLALVLPALVWGWLAARVLAFDALVAHASADERRLILHRHRWPMLGMGVAVGLVGATPSLIWVAGAMTLVLAPLLVLLSVWLYTLFFAFATLWFAHYALAQLQALREHATPPSNPTEAAA